MEHSRNHVNKFQFDFYKLNEAHLKPEKLMSGRNKPAENNSGAQYCMRYTS